MTKHITLKNPPIREALLDIRVMTPDAFDVNSLEKYHNEIIKEYPTKKINTHDEAAIEFRRDKKATLSSKRTHNGYIFTTQANNKIIQFRKDGFTFNKLKPYTNWEDFSSEAKEHWENYLKMTKTALVTRVALRYINLIEIPLPISDFKEYIRTFPEIAPNLPQELREFFVRLVVTEDKTKNVAIITETIDIKQLKKNVSLLPLIFDIDVFNQTNIKPNTSLIWQSFESIRQYKNRIFFESITDKTIKLFEK